MFAQATKGPFLQILRHTAISLKPMSQGDHIMERYGIKATTSQSPIPTDKGSTVQVEAPNIQTLPDFSNSLRSIVRRLHYLLVHGLGAKTLPSPIYFDNVLIFQILHDYWKYHKPTAISKKPMSLRDHNMERNGIKATTSQSPIPSDKGSIVQVEAPEMQTIHFRDELCFSNPAIPLTPCTIPFVVKDESTVQNRDQADRRQMVTDAPEVLDTHLTKEDLNSKVPQNNWREGIFSLRWKHLQVHQVIVVFLLMTSFAQGISSHCDTSRTMNCTQLFLTCSFDINIKQLARNLYMNHVQNKSVDLETILVCQRTSEGFHCETSPTYEFVSVESNRLTVKIPEINVEHFGKYWCDVQGFVDIDQKACQLSLADTSSEDCFEQENGPLGKDDRLSPAIIAIIVLGISLVLVVTSLIFICFVSSGSAKYIAIRLNFKNCKSGRSAPTTNTEDECEKL